MRAIPLLLAAFVLACPTRPARDDDDTPDDDDNGDDDSAADDDDAGDDDDGTPEPCAPIDAHRCMADRWEICTATGWELDELCAPPTDICEPTLGCVQCLPGEASCDGDSVVICDPDGMGTTLDEVCDPGLSCFNGACQDACDVAEQQYSYLGCDFMAVTTINTGLGSGFYNDFAVVIGVPPGGDPADVTVTRNGSSVASQTIAAGTTAPIVLPMVAAIQRPGSLFQNATSVTAPGAAYEVHSSVPVVAYQFNPLHFSTGAFSYSYTNDASLLLPEHVLTPNYRVLTWNTWDYGIVQYRGFAAITGLVDGTSVTFTSSTQTAAGTPGSINAGQSTTFTVDRGDVVQILSGAMTAHDLSGSTISATQPVATFVGHDCTYMPQDQPACDHLEEMAFPVETWGTESVLSACEHPDGLGPATSRYRVLARADGTLVSFDPAVHIPETLDAGQWIEFDTSEDFVVTGSAQFAVMQAMWGQDALQATSGGDPAMGTGIPWSQTRASYDFLVPSTYTTNWLNVAAPSGTPVRLDGVLLSGFTAVGSSGYDVARIEVAPGPHHVESDDGGRFGITAYGYAQYTSYLYPAGLNLLR